MTGVSQRLGDAGRTADHSNRVDNLVRIGVLAYGVVHLAVAWLALQLGLGDPSGSTSSTGALKQVAQQPFGVVLLWLLAAGLLLLALWRLALAMVGHRQADGATRLRRRIISAGKACVYGYLAWSSASIAVGSGSSGSGGANSTTAQVMSWPGGQLLIGAVGLGVICVGGNYFRQAWTEDFAHEFDDPGSGADRGRLYTWIGKVGCAAKGVAFCIVGGFIGYAAATHDPKNSAGLDQALREVLHEPFGPVMLVAVAAGIALYGVFCWAQARHLGR